MSNRTTVLVIEDDPAIRRGIVDALKYSNFGVLECADGCNAAKLAIESTVDLVLLDVMLPGRDGFSILEEVRAAKPTLPVIMVTARGAENDRVRGLTRGADDYVVKPFSALELLARVEAVLRRSPERPSDVRTLRCNGCTVDLERREIAQHQRSGPSSAPSATSQHTSDEPARATLSEREAGILRYLAANRGRAVDRDELLQRVWGLDPRNLETRTVDMHIARLREKLGEQMIQTVRGKGYMLAEHVRSE